MSQSKSFSYMPGLCPSLRVSMLLNIKERGFPTKNSLQSTDFGINRDLV